MDLLRQGWTRPANAHLSGPFHVPPWDVLPQRLRPASVCGGICMAYAPGVYTPSEYSPIAYSLGGLPLPFVESSHGAFPQHVFPQRAPRTLLASIEGGYCYQLLG